MYWLNNGLAWDKVKINLVLWLNLYNFVAMKKDKIYKVLDLFGNEEFKIVEKINNKPDLFHHYDKFLDKFEAKKTTDDCYTPQNVYDLVIDYVNQNYSLTGKKIIRPFYPDGDYENINYPEDCVVIDNPPFSIISKIAKFYIGKEIPFFIFAPHLTLFSSEIDCTHIVVAGDITYANGATIKTSFLSNMFGSAKIIGDATLLKKLKQIQESNKANLLQYDYPDHVLTVSKIAWIIERGISIKIDKKDAKHLRALECQKKHKKGIFGSGFLLSEKAAAEKAAAEKETKIIWELSEKEIKIIKSMG